MRLVNERICRLLLSGYLAHGILEQARELRRRILV